jgi:hypothetical protein
MPAVFADPSQPAQIDRIPCGNKALPSYMEAKLEPEHLHPELAMLQSCVSYQSSPRQGQ